MLPVTPSSTLRYRKRSTCAGERSTKGSGSVQLRSGNFRLLLTAVVDLALHQLLDGDGRGFRHALVVFAHLDLLAVLVHLLEVLAAHGELLQLRAQFLLDLHADLVGAFAQDGHGLVHVPGLLVQFGHITGYRGLGCCHVLAVHGHGVLVACSRALFSCSCSFSASSSTALCG